MSGIAESPSSFPSEDRMPTITPNTQLSELPPEVVVTVLANLPAKGMASAMSVSHTFVSLMDDAANVRAMNLKCIATIPEDRLGGGMVRQLHDVEQGRSRASMIVGHIYEFESVNFPGDKIRVNSDYSVCKSHRNTRASMQFRCVPHVAGQGTVSFESVEFPGRYLRHGYHTADRARGAHSLHPCDEDRQSDCLVFADPISQASSEQLKDFAFILRPALATSRADWRSGPQGPGAASTWHHDEEACIMLEAANKRGSVLRHQYGRLKAHECTDSALGREDSTWRIIDVCNSDA